MNIPPKGSTYTGVDREYLIKSAKENFQRESYQTDFIVSDIYHFKTAKLYDVSICQASLCHMNQPVDLLTVMRNSVSFSPYFKEIRSTNEKGIRRGAKPTRHIYCMGDGNIKGNADRQAVCSGKDGDASFCEEKSGVPSTLDNM